DGNCALRSCRRGHRGPRAAQPADPGVGPRARRRGASREPGRPQPQRLSPDRPGLSGQTGRPMNDVHPPMTAVREVVTRALAEDLGPLGDVTGALIAVDVHARAHLRAREEGVLAGRLAAAEAYAQVDLGVVVSWSLDDGE